MNSQQRRKFNRKLIKMNLTILTLLLDELNDIKNGRKDIDDTVKQVIELINFINKELK